MNQKNKQFNSTFLAFSFILLSSLLCLNSFANEQEELNSKPKLERHFVFDVVPMDLGEITKTADRIFAGICTKAEDIEDDTESKLPVVKYTFKITEDIKGINKKQEITFKQWKPTTRAGGYEIGKKYVLFLYPNSERGLTSTVGVEQGYFEFEERGFILKKEYVRNRLNNKGLTRNLKTHKKVYIKNNRAVNDYIHRCSESGEPIKYKEFVDAVRYLVDEK